VSESAEERSGSVSGAEEEEEAWLSSAKRSCSCFKRARLSTIWIFEIVGFWDAGTSLSRRRSRVRA